MQEQQQLDLQANNAAASSVKAFQAAKEELEARWLNANGGGKGAGAYLARKGKGRGGEIRSVFTNTAPNTARRPKIQIRSNGL